ncbi:MAG: hypothetical protein KKE76_11600 [Gammaproteobacteria bacterium]|nr:hypothetical protein [Gammaproteobacteria bacterium]
MNVIRNYPINSSFRRRNDGPQDLLTGLWFFLALLLLLGFCDLATASDKIDIIPLKNRTAEEVMPLIRPMLDANEVLSGTGFQLIVRASAERQQEIRSLVTQLDQSIRQLRISVRRAAREEIEREGARANVNVGVVNGDVEARGRAIIHSTRDKSGERNNYQVTTLEGTPAYINTGEAFPVPTQNDYVVNGQVVVTQGLEYQQLNSGFYALARTQGNSVSIDISPQREVLDPRGSGRIQSTSLVTSVRGRLGEWLELGGTSQQRSHEGGGLLRSTRGKDDTQQTLWLKVDAVE